MFINGKFIPFSLLMSVEGEGEPSGGDSAKVITLQQRLDAANGSAMVVAQQLSNENFTLRTEGAKAQQTISTLTGEVAELKKKLPPDGARVLTKDEAAAYDALLLLGKPEDIKAKLGSVPALEAKIADGERATLLAKVAELAGFNAKVFTPLAKDLQFEIKTEAGKEVAYVKVTAEGKETLTPVAEYAQSNLTDFLPSLKPADTPRRHVKQDPGGTTEGGSVFDRIRAREKAKQETQKQDSKPLHERLNLVRSA